MSNKTPTYVGRRQISYRFNNGVPNQLSQRRRNERDHNSLLYMAFYVQDQWTRNG